MKAPDVALTEAVIGSGLVTALFVFTLLSIKKEDAK
jgi:energy-converting hydrogenase B subunit D